ncbi:SMC domain protein [Ammonifex degensii KC4]|uniref:Nuclease SbcCD subunit C n=1 Tax=Ammonifex degensii (strain DSM 10501 / KC4) TaxID=429009 RepID=C9R960_AMMDK|nr:AAA family ATPase [Ammonifex degensii]ACX52839.1 SMC domain protein [Ammonifex degensii KC4]
MPKIRRIILENFQSHRYTEIELSPTVTVLVGESDRGKSAVVRALRWLFYNRPQGEGLVRAGSHRCRVAVELEDGLLVEREREGKTNRYCIKYPDGKSLRLESPGRSVPKEVEELTGIKPYSIGNQSLELHLAHQLDPPFLLRESPSVRAQVIGQIAGADLFQRAAKAALREQSQWQGRIKSLEESVAALRKKISPLQEELPQLEEKLKTVRELVNGVLKAEERRAELLCLKEKRERLRREAAFFMSALARLPSEEILAAKLAELEELERRYGQLSKAAEARRRVSAALAREEEILRSLSRLPFAEERGKELGRLGEKFAQLHRYREERQKRLDYSKKLELQVLSRLHRLAEAEEAFCRADAALRLYRELARCWREKKNRAGELEAEARKVRQQEEALNLEAERYRRALSSLQRCPLCGTDLTPEHVEKVWRQELERMGIVLGEQL